MVAYLFDKEESGQLTFGFSHKVSFRREDFFRSSANNDAVKWLESWPSWPHMSLCLYGPKGSGKSHLGNLWARQAFAQVIQWDEMHHMNQWLFHLKPKALVLDCGDHDVTDRASFSDHLQENLFHLYNLMFNAKGHILWLAREAPAQWAVTLPDLESRLRSIPAMHLQAPDEDLLSALYMKLFSDRQLLVSPDVVKFLVNHFERSYEKVADMVDFIDKESLKLSRKITIPFIKEII